MGLKRRTPQAETSTVEYEKLENGEYEGRLAYVADLGLQEGMIWKGEQKPNAQQICLGIEIIGKHVTIDEVARPRVLWTEPMNIFSTLTEKGKEMKYYSVFNKSAKEGEVADWEAVLGTPCNVIVGKSQSKDGTKEYDNIDRLEPMPEKYHKDVPAGEIEPAIGDSDDPDNVVTQALFGLPLYVYKKRIVDDSSVPF